MVVGIASVLLLVLLSYVAGYLVGEIVSAVRPTQKFREDTEALNAEVKRVISEQTLLRQSLRETQAELKYSVWESNVVISMLLEGYQPQGSHDSGYSLDYDSRGEVTYSSWEGMLIDYSNSFSIPLPEPGVH